MSPARTDPPTEISGPAVPADATSLHPDCREANSWFCGRVQQEFGQNLQGIAAYGPAVTRVFDRRHHYIHHLLIVRERRLESLLRLGESSREAAHRRIAPPLIITAAALERSYDVFPLEWLDIAMFHRTVVGHVTVSSERCEPGAIRSQCERELRSLDIQLQRGILASNGRESRIGRLENEASDALIRTMRGIVWLSGDRGAHLPEDLCRRCETVVRRALEGCRQAIRFDGRHDRRTMSMLLNELGLLSDWIDAHP